MEAHPNGYQLIDFIEHHNLNIWNTSFQKTVNKCWTYRSPTDWLLHDVSDDVAASATAKLTHLQIQLPVTTELLLQQLNYASFDQLRRNCSGMLSQLILIFQLSSTTPLHLALTVFQLRIRITPCLFQLLTPGGTWFSSDGGVRSENSKMTHLQISTLTKIPISMGKFQANFEKWSISTYFCL